MSLLKFISNKILGIYNSKISVSRSMWISVFFTILYWFSKVFFQKAINNHALIQDSCPVHVMKIEESRCDAAGDLTVSLAIEKRICFIKQSDLCLSEFYEILTC
jgi:hypothetical protein